MATRMPFALIFPILFLSACINVEAQSVTFTFTNNCPSTIWPAGLNGAGRPPLSSTGFILTAGASSTLTVVAPWSGRFWARTRCSTDYNTGKFTCATGDCASGTIQCNGSGGIPPATLAEFTLRGNDGEDYYDISLVDGFNVPLAITPEGQSGDSICNSTSCAADLNGLCDPKLAVKGSDGTVIACRSACLAFNRPQFCCSGAFRNPDTCQPSSYSLAFKQQCPQAYTYAYDDKSSLFTCSSGVNYLITFCP